MKDIYELLNDIDIDDSEFEEIEASEIEKAKVKRTLKTSINQNRKKKSWKKNLVVAAMIVGLSVPIFGLTFPTYAGSIPVVGDIFRFLDNGRTGMYDEYKEYSTELNMTEESNGIRITINNVIFDGKTVFLTYSLESEQDLGDSPFLYDSFEIKGATSQTGSSQISKVDNNRYVGLITITGHGNDENRAKVKWNIKGITMPNQEKELKGNWNFAFALEATESNSLSINHSSEKNGVEAKIEKISITPMSVIVYYDQIVSEKTQNKWHGVDVDIQITDDLGNSYSGEGNGGTGDGEGYNVSWSKTFEKLDVHATKLIITPHVTLYEHTSENFGGVEISEDGEEKELEIPIKPGKGREDFVMEEIIIDLKN